MSATQQGTSRGWGRRFRTALFWIITVVLVGGTLWSVGILLSTGLSNTDPSRQEFYAGTATALAPANNESAKARLQHIQFATNTPADQPTQAPTETPIPPMATATPQEQPTLSADSTPVQLPTFIPYTAPEVAEVAGTAVPPKAAVIPRDYELINIVLLGGDDEITNDNTIRTDTIIIVSVNTETGTVSMLNLPRDLFVYVPTPTMTRLNTVFGIGESFGWQGGGFELLRQTIFYNFGIQVHYYARVDISGMAELIDALGGVDLAVDCAYQDFALVGAEVPSDAIIIDEEALLYELPVGYYRMSGSEALWFARTRSQGNADDFDRGRRQQQLLRAMFSAGLSNGQLAQIPELWGEITQVVETDIPLGVVVGLLPLGLNLDAGEIETFTWVKGLHSTPWQPPIGPFAGQSVHLPIPDAVTQLLNDFYTPPTSSQLEISGPSIAVYNGTANADWDLVASERLRSVGLNAFAAGPADTMAATTYLIDYRLDEKGSPVRRILEELNMTSNDVTPQPDPNSPYDYNVIIGDNYTSCVGSVLQ